MSEAIWKVVRQTANGLGRVLFEGIEDDARLYLENHFPRVHTEPGSSDEPLADAVLVGPNNETETFTGPESGYLVDDDSDDSDDDGDDDSAPARPAPRASVDAWREYVLATHDLSNDDKSWLESASKADIIAEYGQENAQ